MPSATIFPEVGKSNVANIFINVVLPAPLGPGVQHEKLLSIESPIVIRTLPQSARHHGLRYGHVVNNIPIEEDMQDRRIIRIGKEHRVISSG
jgi:hypothetical protein